MDPMYSNGHPSHGISRKTETFVNGTNIGRHTLLTYQRLTEKENPFIYISYGKTRYNWMPYIWEKYQTNNWSRSSTSQNQIN